MTNLDLNLLRVLDVMLRERSVTVVAERLGMTQPTVSYGLKKLRMALDDALFIRTAQGMEPTPKALALAEPVRRMLDIVATDILNPQPFDPASSERTFTINTTDIGEMVFIPPLLKRLREFAPRATAQCMCLPPRELATALGNGEVDLAIGYQPELPEGNIYVQGLFEHPFVCLVREGHPLIGDSLSLVQYTEVEHVAFTGEGHSQKLFEALIAKSVPQRRIAFRAQHFMNIAFIIRETDLVATVPKVIAATFCRWPGLRVLPLPFDMPQIPIKQYWHSKYNKDAAVIWLRHTVRDLFLDKDPTADFVVGPAD